MAHLSNTLDSPPNKNRGMRGKKETSIERKQDEDVNSIRDVISKSSLYEEFRIKNERAKNDSSLVRTDDQFTIPQELAQDWRPVVCKQTQQFLHSNDVSQKSEYKHF